MTWSIHITNILSSNCQPTLAQVSPGRASILSVRTQKELTPQVLGRRIAIAREHKNLSQRDLEKLIGVTGVGQWEKGRNFPEFANLLKIAQALDQPLSYFFGDDYDKRPQEQRLAERVAEHIAPILQKHSGQEIQKSLIDEFLDGLRYDQVAKDSISAIRAGARGSGRDRMQKAITNLDPATIEAIARHGARQILERFVAYVRSKRGSR